MELLREDFYFFILLIVLLVLTYKQDHLGLGRKRLHKAWWYLMLSLVLVPIFSFWEMAITNPQNIINSASDVQVLGYWSLALRFVCYIIMMWNLTLSLRGEPNEENILDDLMDGLSRYGSGRSAPGKRSEPELENTEES